jgi:hypothetical protein
MVSNQRFMIICSEPGRKVPEGDKAAMNGGLENLNFDTKVLFRDRDGVLAGCSGVRGWGK